ncbi:MAG: AAA family ATPase [Spirochaeta sp.]|jgi:type II secretory pathway predicted ATPase ExeA|nr:AAA family ATPase [Spirochaeta sp.]
MREVILTHYGFSRLPFGKDIVEEKIFHTEELTRTAAMLELGIESEDVMLLSGPIGCGKSLIIRHGLAGLDTNRYQPIYLRGNISGEGELVKALLRGMKIEPPHSLGKAKPAFFSAVEESSRKPVVVLDDAQDIAEEALISIKALTNFDSDSQNRITFILTGQPELRTLLGYSHFDSLRARIRLSHHLSPMGLEETASYIDHGLEVANRKEKLFSDSAKMEIFKRSNGIARQVNRICYNAIVAGAIEKKNLIDSTDLHSDEL